MSTIKQTVGPLLPNLTLRHGPHDQLGRFFLRAVEAVQEKGVELSFTTLDDLVVINAANQATWMPLFPTFDPRLSMLTPSNAFCIVGRDRSGDVVVTQAGRLFEWTNTNLEKECKTLRFFYDDPHRQALPDEACEVTAETASQISGRVTFIGALWYRPDIRALGISPYMARIGRMYGYTRWAPDFSTAMISDANRALKPAQSGHENVDWEVTLKNSKLGTVRMALIWSSADWILDDSLRFLTDMETQVDAGVQHRRAQQSS